MNILINQKSSCSLNRTCVNVSHMNTLNSYQNIIHCIWPKNGTSSSIHCCTSYSKQIENKPDKLNKTQLFVAISPKIFQGVEGVNHTFYQQYLKKKNPAKIR